MHPKAKLQKASTFTGNGSHSHFSTNDIDACINFISVTYSPHNTKMTVIRYQRTNRPIPIFSKTADSRPIPIIYPCISSLVVSTSAIDCLERLFSGMSCCVSSDSCRLCAAGSCECWSTATSAWCCWADDCSRWLDQHHTSDDRWRPAATATHWDAEFDWRRDSAVGCSRLPAGCYWQKGHIHTGNHITALFVLHWSDFQYPTLLSHFRWIRKFIYDVTCLLFECSYYYYRPSVYLALPGS